MEDWRKVKRAVFARHSNPWSAWTRWASTPLMLVPVWRRSGRDAALVGVWIARPRDLRSAHDRAWVTRAVLGEEQWIAERPMDTAMAVNIAATVAGLVAMVAARRRRVMPAAAATALEMGLLMAYWGLMVRYHDRNGGVTPKVCSRGLKVTHPYDRALRGMSGWLLPWRICRSSIRV